MLFRSGPVAQSTSHASSSHSSHSSHSGHSTHGGKVSGASGEHVHGQREPKRPELQANVSAPELHVPPQREVPVRSTTVPVMAPIPSTAPTTTSLAQSVQSVPSTSAQGVSAPPITKSRSRKPSIATPPKDLDSIDELDETDPLGVGWHNSGPYDAIPKPTKKKGGDGGADGTRGPRIFVSVPRHNLTALLTVTW